MTAGGFIGTGKSTTKVLPRLKGVNRTEVGEVLCAIRIPYRRWEFELPLSWTKTRF